jgi:hypothetical protein
MAGRLAFDPGGNLPTLLLIKSGRLEVECRQHGPGAPAPPCFLLRHGEDPANQVGHASDPPTEKPLNRQEAEVSAAQ